MARSDYDEHASFMMLCLGDFSSKLCIPIKFMTKFGQAVQHSMILESDSSETSWDVKIKKLNSDFYMKDGWPDFVKDNQLDDLDLLTFRLAGESTFKVSIFKSDGCLQPPKHPSPPTTSDVVGKESGIKRGRGRSRKRESPIPHRRFARGSTARSCFFKEGNSLYYETRLKNHHKYKVCLPIEFSKAANMRVRKEVRMEYVGRNRHGVGMSVKVDPRPEAHRVDLSKGWSQFRKANGLVCGKGKYCSFEFDPINQVIYVKKVAPR